MAVCDPKGQRLWAGLNAPEKRPSTGAIARYFSCCLPAGLGDLGAGSTASSSRRIKDLISETTMPTVKLGASTILRAYDEAQSELVGKAVVLTDGKAGTVENIWLDEIHGLRISIRGHDGKWPVSTIKFTQR